MTTELAPKAPEDVVDYAITLAGAGLSGDSVDTYVLTPSDITIDSDSLSGDTITFWVSGGTLNTNAKIAIAATTVGGRQIKREVMIPIRAL